MARYHLHLTQSQKAQLFKSAAKAGMSVSRYVRSQLFAEDDTNNYVKHGNGSKKRVEEIRAEKRVDKILSRITE